MPADGLRGRRKVVAIVERGGVARYSLDVARFNASAAARPGARGSVSVRALSATGKRGPVTERSLAPPG
jgi:hypothetical protein